MDWLTGWRIDWFNYYLKKPPRILGAIIIYPLQDFWLSKKSLEWRPSWWLNWVHMRCMGILCVHRCTLKGDIHISTPLGSHFSKVPKGFHTEKALGNPEPYQLQDLQGVRLKRMLSFWHGPHFLKRTKSLLLISKNVNCNKMAILLFCQNWRCFNTEVKVEKAVDEFLLNLVIL